MNVVQNYTLLVITKNSKLTFLAVFIMKSQCSTRSINTSSTLLDAAQMSLVHAFSAARKMNGFQSSNLWPKLSS